MHSIILPKPHLRDYNGYVVVQLELEGDRWATNENADFLDAMCASTSLFMATLNSNLIE